MFICIFTIVVVSGYPWLCTPKGDANPYRDTHTHTERERGGIAWLQISIVYGPEGPPIFNNSPTAPALSFLPSSLTPDKLTEQVTTRTGVSLQHEGKELEISVSHTTYLHLWMRRCDERGIPGDRGSGYRIPSPHPMTVYLDRHDRLGHMVGLSLSLSHSISVSILPALSISIPLSLSV